MEMVRKCSEIQSFFLEGCHWTSALTENTFHRMRLGVKFCFAIDLVTAGAAGHEYPKLDCESTVHRICLLSL